MRLIKIAFLLVLILTLLAVLTPFAAKHYALAWLEQRGFNATISKVGLNVLSGKWSLQDVQIESRDGQQLKVYEASIPFKPMALFSQKLSLDVVQLDDVEMDLRVTDEGYEIAGLPIEAFLPAEDSAWALGVRRLGFGNLSVCVRERAHCWQIDDAVLSGLRLEQGQDARIWHVDQGLVVNKAFYRDQKSGAAILFLNQLQTQSTTWSANSVTTRNLAVANLQWVETPAEEGSLAELPYQTQIGSLDINTAALLGDKLQLGNVDISSLRQAYQVDADGNNVMRQRLLAWFPDHEAMIKSGMPFSDIRVESLKVSGSEWAIDDESVSPRAKTILHSVQLTLGAMDSAKPTEATDFLLNAKQGESGQLSVEGSWQIFADAPTITAKGRVGNFDVDNISAYASRMFGQKLTEGTVDATFEGGVTQGAVDLSSVWRLTDFVFVPGTADRAGGMPLNRSVALLADSNNSVKVAFDISGNVKEEGSTLTQLIGTPMRRALSRQVQQGGNKQQAVSALTATKPGQIIVSSMVYDANATRPRDHEVKRLAQLAKRLKEKDSLRMTFCPVSTGGEWAEIYNAGRAPQGGSAPITNAQRNALIKLAEKRSAWMAEHLLKIGVSKKQIVPCGPTLDPTESGPSYITVSL